MILTNIFALILSSKMLLHHTLFVIIPMVLILLISSAAHSFGKGFLISILYYLVINLNFLFHLSDPEDKKYLLICLLVPFIINWLILYPFRKKRHPRHEPSNDYQQPYEPGPSSDTGVSSNTPVSRIDEVLSRYGFNSTTINNYEAPNMFKARSLVTADYTDEIGRQLPSGADKIINTERTIGSTLSSLHNTMSDSFRDNGLDYDSIERQLHREYESYKDFLKQYRSTESGTNGENRVYYWLRNHKFTKEYILRDLNLRQDYGKSHSDRSVNQMDIVVICPCGIFILEVKNNFEGNHGNVFIINGKGYINHTSECIIHQMRWHDKTIKRFLRRILDEPGKFPHTNSWDIPVYNLAVPSNKSVHHARNYYDEHIQNFHYGISMIRNLDRVMENCPKAISDEMCGILAGEFNKRANDRPYEWLLLNDDFSNQNEELLNYCEAVKNAIDYVTEPVYS